LEDLTKDNRVESTRANVLSMVTNHTLETVFDFTSSLVGEGQKHDVRWRYSRVNHRSYTMNHGFGFSGSSASIYEDCTFQVFSSSFLLIIESCVNLINRSHRGRIRHLLA